MSSAKLYLADWRLDALWFLLSVKSTVWLKSPTAREKAHRFGEKLLQAVFVNTIWSPPIVGVQMLIKNTSKITKTTTATLSSFPFAISWIARLGASGLSERTELQCQHSQAQRDFAISLRSSFLTTRAYATAGHVHLLKKCANMRNTKESSPSVPVWSSP